MNYLRSGLYSIVLVLAAAALGGCASWTTATGEPGVDVGDSYQKVLAVISRNNTVTNKVDGQDIQAEGYSTLFKDCRVKHFVFQGADGLQAWKYEPAPHLSVKQNCRRP